MCHIAMLLLGYNIYSLFKSTFEGLKYINRNMKAILKENQNRRYKIQDIRFFLRTRSNFCILTFKEILILYRNASDEVQEEILAIV